MFDMNEILARLQNGEKIEDIGNEIAGLMNQAVAAHNAELEAEAAKKQAEADKAQAKRDLIEELVDIVKELAILEGMDPDELEVTEEDMDQMVATFTEMFEAMRDLKKMLSSFEASVEAKPTPKAPSVKVHLPKSDEQILADFLKMFN